MTLRTTLRFHRDDVARPRMTPQSLANLTAAMKRLAEVVTLDLTGQQASVEMFIVADPAEGSLQIVLEPTIYVNGDAVLQLKDYALAAGATALASVPVFDFIWKVVFGGRGLIDLLRGTAGTQSAAPDQPSLQINIEETAKGLVKSGVAKSDVIGVLEVARTFDMDRIEVTVHGDRSVIIFDRHKRTSIGSLGRYANKPPEPLPAGLIGISRDLTTDVEVKVGGMVLKAFIGVVNGQKLLCIWAATGTPPWVSEMQVIVESVSLDDVEAIGDTQYEHALAEGAVMIRGYLST